MAVYKSLETMSGVILNQPKFAAKSVANEMFESHVVTMLTERASIFDCKALLWADSAADLGPAQARVNVNAAALL